MERRTSTLDELLLELRQRFGTQAARRGAALLAPGPPATLATGLAPLDAALPHGGLPRDALTELVGPRSAGATSLALAVIAQAQLSGELACLLDLGRTFAPAAAAQAGVDLASLAVARPADGAEAALVVATLLARRAVGVLLIDSLPAWLALPGGPAALASLRTRLPHLLRGSGCVLLVLHPLPTGLLPDPADAGRAAITGSRTQIAVQLPPFVETSAAVLIELPFARGEDQARSAACDSPRPTRRRCAPCACASTSSARACSSTRGRAMRRCSSTSAEGRCATPGATPPRSATSWAARIRH